ncbi:MAG: phage holin family protein [Armatimonadota bacterium]
MKGLLIRWIISAIALFITAKLAQMIGIEIELSGALPAFIAVAVLTIVNAFIKPLLTLLTLPLNCLTLGLFTLVINALMFWLAGSVGIRGFRVDGMLAALFGSIVMSLICGIANHLTGINDRE